MNLTVATMRPVTSGQRRSSVAATIAIWVLAVYTTCPPDFEYEAVGKGMPTEGSPMSRVVWLSLLAFGVGVTLSRSGAALKLLRKVNPYLLVFLALVALSTMWSIESEVTIRRFIRATTIILDATAFALLDGRTTSFQSVVRPILTMLLVGSMIFVATDPQLAIEQDKFAAVLNAWHGLTTQKNALGSEAAIALILWLHAWLTNERPKWQTGLGLAVSLICLVKSRSSTAIMAAAFSAPLLFVLIRPPAGLRRYLPYLIGMFTAVLLLYSLAVLNLLPGSNILLSPITMVTGKDLTFSNRTAIWAVINEHIALRPLLGSGFGAYWVDVPDSPSQEMRRRLWFYPTEGHNGYLDVINDLGAVGALCLLAYLITYLRQGLRIFAVLRPQGALYLALLFDQMIGNLFESHWFNILNCEFVIMTSATLAMARLSVDLQNRPPMGSRSAPAGPLKSPRRVAPRVLRRPLR
jgi:O-antigen ligase